MRPVCLTEDWQKNKQEVCPVLYGLFLWHSSLGTAGLSWEPFQTKHAHCSNLNLSRKLLAVKWKLLAAVSLNERGFWWDAYANRCRAGSREFVLGSHSLNHLQSLSVAASSHSLSPTSPVPRSIIVRVCRSWWGHLYLLCFKDTEEIKYTHWCKRWKNYQRWHGKHAACTASCITASHCAETHFTHPLIQTWTLCWTYTVSGQRTIWVWKRVRAEPPPPALPAAVC